MPDKNSAGGGPAWRPGRKYVFICQSCGHQVGKWQGRCPGCGAWNSLAEEVVGPRLNVSEVPLPPRRSTPQPLALLKSPPETRQPSGIAEFDRVLGGAWWPVPWCSWAGTRG